MPRVATSQIYDRVQSNVAEAREREAITTQKAASQKEILRPSDNPQDWAIAKQFKDEVSIQETLGKNAGLAQHLLGATEQIFKQATEYVERAYELGLSGVDKDERTQQAVLSEVDTLFTSLLQTLNTRYGNRTLLAGFHSGGPAFDEEGKFLGDNEALEIELEKGKRVALNVSGEAAIYGKASSEGVNVIDIFDKLRMGLREQDNDAIRETFPDFLKAVNQLTGYRTEIGSRMNRIERALNTHESDKIERLDVVARLEEADPIKVFSDLARDQTALRASLDSSHKLLTEVPPDKLFR